MKILLDEEYGYKMYLVIADCTKEELQAKWDSFPNKSQFYGSALGFFRKAEIPHTSRPLDFCEDWVLVLKEGIEDNDHIYDSSSYWESANGVVTVCSIHLHEYDDSSISFTSRTL